MNIELINNFFEIVMDNALISFCLGTLTLGGFLLAIFAIPRKRISHAFSTFPLIQKNISKISNLKLLYDDKPIDNLSITKYVIWNSGNRSIRKSDLVPLAPLCFKLCNDKTQILDIGFTKINEESTNPELTGLNLSFDYLDRKNGVIIQIIHSGSFSDFYFTGKIIGGKLKNKDISANHFVKLFNHAFSPRVMKILNQISLVLFVIGYILIFLIILLGIFSLPFSLSTIFLIFLDLFIASLFYIIYKANIRIPRDLKTYTSFEDIS